MVHVSELRRVEHADSPLRCVDENIVAAPFGQKQGVTVGADRFDLIGGEESIENDAAIAPPDRQIRCEAGTKGRVCRHGFPPNRADPLMQGLRRVTHRSS